MENNVAGLGCAIRDHGGRLIAVVGVRQRSRLVCMTELHAAQAALNLASQLDVDFIGAILEGDSFDVCSRLNKILVGGYIEDCETSVARLLPAFPKIVVSLINRKANSVADHLAKNACLLDFEWVRGMSLTTSLAQLLAHDATFL
ncbi:hypothetical protein KSP40_PGU021781 [Platanthera guangdongensis]|uniref:RNase H type-1 domain-containing protein n=1 Tax=Platanthera guangdongensis TaxID=2320717 RepID=A0ABR2LQT4_9ASPA